MYSKSKGHEREEGEIRCKVGGFAQIRKERRGQKKQEIHERGAGERGQSRNTCAI